MASQQQQTLPPLPQRLQLFVAVDSTERTVALDVDAADSVASVLLKLAALGELPQGAQPHLLLRGRSLEGERRLMDYGIQTEATLHFRAARRRARGSSLGRLLDAISLPLRACPP